MGGTFFYGRTLFAYEVEQMSSNKAVISDESERLMDVSIIESFQLAQGILIYPAGNDWVLPLGEFSESLGISIELSAYMGLAQGFIVSEDRKFQLDVRKCRVEIAGKIETFNCKEAIVHGEEIYVHRLLLERWFPVTILIDSLSSKILLKTKERLPIEARKERERLAESTKGVSEAFDPGFPEEKDPYSLLSFPTISEQWSLTRQTTTDKSAFAFQHNTQFGAEFLGLEGTGFMTGINRDIQNLRIGFAKRSANGDLLGPLHVREINLMNLALPFAPLITRGGTGKGFLLSNYPIRAPTTFQNNNFEGDLPPGWEVILYRNDVLIDRFLANGTGRYFFRDVPLIYGNNIFRLSFFGPQGQRRDEYQTFNISQDLIAPGTRNFKFGIAELDNNGPQRLQFQYAENFSKYFTTNFGMVRDHLSDTYSWVGLTGVNPLFLVNTLCAISHSGKGKACEWSELMGIGSAFTLGLKYTRLMDFHSEVFNPKITDDQNSQLSGNLLYRIPLIPAATIGFGLIKNGYDSADSVTLLKNNIGVSAGQAVINNELNYQLATPGSTSGKWSIDYRPSVFGFRFSSEYTATAIKSFEGELSKTVDDYAAGLGLRYNLDSDSYNFSVNINRNFKKFTAGFNTTASSASNYSMSLLLSFTVVPEPITPSARFYGLLGTNLGSIAVQAFKDANRNGIFDAGEQPVPNIRLAVNLSESEISTDENGVSLLTGLQPYIPAHISVGSNSIEDPFLFPAKKGIRIIPRAGHISSIAFPFVTFGQVDGTVTVKSKSGYSPKRGLIVEVRDLQGKVVATTKTDRMGIYQVDRVPVGTFTINLSSKQLQELGFFPHPEERKVTIPEEGGFESEQDFILERD